MCVTDILFFFSLECQLESKDLSKIIKAIWDARNKWEDIGLVLGIEYETLQSIEENNQGRDKVNRCFRDMLHQWLISSGDKSCSTLASALCDQTVRMGSVADECCIHAQK